MVLSVCESGSDAREQPGSYSHLHSSWKSLFPTEDGTRLFHKVRTHSLLDQLQFVMPLCMFPHVSLSKW